MKKIGLNKTQLISIFVLVILVLVIPLTLTLTKKRQEIRKKAAGGPVTVSLSPTNVSKSPSDTFDINVVLTSSETRVIGGAGVVLTFDPNFFTINSVACDPDFPTKPSTNGVSGNTISLDCAIEGGGTGITLQPGISKTVSKFNVTVKNQASGQTTINFTFAAVGDLSGNDIAGTVTPGTYTINAIPTNTPTPTPPPGQVKVQLKVKFFGINQNRANQPVRIRILKGGTMVQEIGFEGVNLTANNEGVYQSEMLTLSSAVEPGSGYTFLVKGPKHLQTRYCQNNGQTRACTSGNITLAAGENILDFTGLPLPPGDLPIPTTGGQDGVINAFDAVFLSNCLRDNPESADCLSRADLNLDGLVSALDGELINWSIFTRWEDE